MKDTKVNGGRERKGCMEIWPSMQIFMHLADECCRETRISARVGRMTSFNAAYLAETTDLRSSPLSQR